MSDPGKSASVNFLRSVKALEKHAAWRDARFIHNILGDGIKFSKLSSQDEAVESYMWLKNVRGNGEITDGDAYNYAKGSFEYSVMRINIDRSKLCVTSSDLNEAFGQQIFPLIRPLIHFHAGPDFVPETNVMSEDYASGPLRIYVAFTYKRCASTIGLSLGERAKVLSD